MKIHKIYFANEIYLMPMQLNNERNGVQFKMHMIRDHLVN